MIHGHSTIELTDVNTGEVERYEDDNLVTNGLQYYSRFNAIPEDFWKNLLSGIKLFDGKLKEDKETVFAPIGVNLVGYAGLNADTTESRRGLFNLEQSGVLEDRTGVKLVWDFSQSQANGTIACVGITPNIYVDTGSDRTPDKEYGLRTISMSLSRDAKTGGILSYDPEKRIAITFDSNKTTGKIYFAESYVRFYVWSVIDESPSYKILRYFNCDIPGYDSSCTYFRFIGCIQGYYNFICIKNIDKKSEPYRTTFLLAKLKKDTFEVSTETFTFSEEAYPKNYLDDITAASFIMNDGLYLSNYWDKKIYKFRVDDHSFIKILSSDEISQSLSDARFPAIVRKDGAILKYVSIDHNDNLHPEKIAIGKNGFYCDNIVTILDGRYALFRGLDALSFYESTFLFTINNLSSPVVKTADKTMKITYILREDYGDTPTPPTP